MNKKIYLSIIVSLLTTNIYSQTFELGQIDVISSSEDKKFDNNVLYEEDIQNQEKKTILEALNTVSGINIYNSGARNEQMINVRGFDVKHAPLYIDGIPIAVAYDGYVDFSRFTTFDLSQIQVSKGLTSPLLGVNTFAGAINLVTKRPTKELEGVISAGTFTGNGKKAYLNIGSKQDKFYIQASGSYLSRDNYPLSDNFTPTSREDGDKREQSDTEDKKLNLKIGYTPNDTDEYAINYINQKANKGVPYNTIPTETARYWDWNYWNKESIYFLSKTDFKYFYMKSRIFYDKFKNSLSIYSDNTYSNLSYGGVGNPSWYDDDTKGISLEFGQVQSTNNDLKFAIHAKKDTHKEGAANQIEVYQMSVNSYSIGIEDTYKFNDNTRIIIGGSYDKDDITRADNTRYDSTSTDPLESLKEFEHKGAASFNPMVKLEYDLNEDLKFYGGIAKKTRLPSIKDRYSYRMNRYIPNPNLQEEQTINYEIGFQKYFENSSLKGNIFYADIKDYIQANSVVYNGSTVEQNQNIGEVTSKGLELEYFHTFENGLIFEGSYTKLSIENDDDSIKIINVPTDKIAVALSYKPIKDLTTNLNMQYASSKKTSDVTPYNETGSMTVWNTKFIYDITKTASFDFGVNNIFDKNYQLDYGFPEAGRVFFGNLTYRF